MIFMKHKILIFGVLAAILIAIFFPTKTNNSPQKNQAGNTNINTPSVMEYPKMTDGQNTTISPMRPTVNKNIQKYQQRISELLTALTPPEKPTWEIVQDYRKKSQKTAEDDAKVLSSLSYCINMQGSSDALIKAKSSGTAVAGEIAALENNVDQSSKFCGRLLDSDYQIRSDIVAARAQKGDTEAMLAFMDVGPRGRWQADFAVAGISAEELQAWKHTAADYLEKAAMAKNLAALNTLASIYSVSPKSHDELNSMFVDMYDPVKSYGYAYAWVYSMKPDGNMNINNALSNYLNHFERNLSTDQIQRGKHNAEKILSVIQRVENDSKN